MLCNPHRHHVGRVAVINGVTKTSTGTQSYTVTGFESRVPVGCIIIANCTATGDSELTDVSDSTQCVGASDGTNHRALLRSSEDGLTTSDAGKVASHNSCLILGLANASSILVEANVDSFDAMGVTLDFTTASATAYNLSIMLFFDCNFYVGDQTLSGTAAATTSVTGVGFKPSGMLFLFSGQSSEMAWDKANRAAGYAGTSFGDEVEDFQMHFFQDIDAQGTTNCRSRHGTTDDHIVRYGGTGNRHEISSYDDDGFTTVNSSGTWDAPLGFACWDNIRTHTEDENYTGTSTGTFGAPTFTPHAALMIGTSNPTAGSQQQAAPGTDSMSLGMAGDLTGSMVQASYSMYQDDAVGTTNTRQQYATDRVSIDGTYIITSFTSEACNLSYVDGGVGSGILFGT